MRSTGWLAAAGFIWLQFGTAAGQAMQETRGAEAGAFDFYVLSLSWSPGFCQTSSTGASSRQCKEGGKGFVIHGLWPQWEIGYPSFCRSNRRSVPRAALRDAEGLFPSDNLARYQWRKHGICTGKRPGDYFAAVKQARAKVQIPDRFDDAPASTRVMPWEIELAFTRVNPGLRPEMMSIACGRRVLQEIRICMDRDLQNFRVCPEVDQSGCRDSAVAVPAVR